MNHLNPGLISAYNSLTDKHLAGYFSSTRIRRHLHRAGLITRSGRIVPDKEYRQKLIQRAHQRHVRECLAQAIFHKVLEMERLHQIEIKRKLEEFARRERVHKIKVERSKRYEEDIIRILSPHPPTGARGIRKQHSGPEGEHTESSESPGSSRPNTAPGKMQRPVRLKPLHSNSTTASHRHSSPYRRQHPPHHNQRPFNGTMDKDPDRRLNTMEVRNGISPYCLPVINNFVTPVPPSTRRKERPVKLSTSGTVRGRRLRPTTGSSAADVSEDPPSMLRSSVPQSRVRVNMVYLGKSVHLSNDLPDLRDEVKVFQQHCGGENLCIYKGKLREGESFQFTSRRHRGFPFSLTFFLNGLQVERLSSCCEFKHRKSSRLGGRHGHFAFTGVEAASPCYKCIIALGLDKKPVPPPKRMKEDAVKMGIVPRLTVTAGVDTETTKAEDPVSRSECESSPRKDTEEERAHEDSKVKDDYEEDFEADDEGPVEEEKEKKCTSPNGEREEKGKETPGPESEASEKEDGVKSRSGSSFTGSDREESDAEEVKEAKAEDTEEPPEDAQEEVQEEAPRGDAAAAQSTEAKDSETQDSAGQSTEIEIGDNSGPSGNENRETSDTHTSEGERRTDESTQDEPERAKSVQEKLAEAVLRESHCSSEPELSDTSTETEASSNKSAEKGTKVAEAVAETTTGQLEVIEEEKKMEEPVMREVKAVVHTSEEQEEIVVDNAEPNDRVSDKAASEVAKEAGENETSEEIVVDATTSALQDEPKDEVREDGEATEQDAKSVQKEDESAASDLSHKPNESVEADNTEPLTVTETMEMKAEAPDTQEAVGAEEGPATDTQGNDTKQEVEEQTQEEGEVKTKEELICEDAKEESVAESEEKQKIEGKNEGQEATEEQSDLNEGEKDKPLEEGNTEDLEENKPESDVIEEVAEEAGANLNPDEQNKDGLEKSEKEAEDMGENKPEGELMSEENAKVVKLLDTGLNTAKTRDDADKTSSQKDVSEKAKEEPKRTEQDGSQKEDAHKEKSDDEDERNTVKDQGETQDSEGEAKNNPGECADKEVAELGNPGSTSLKEEGQETSADKCEDSAQLTEENVKSEDVAASVAEDAPKDTENNAQEAEESEKGNKDVSEEADVKEVDAENGEVSVVPDAKQTVEDVQKEESENTIDDAQNMGENGKLEPSNEPEKAELKQDNRNNGHDINNVASEEIVKPPSKDSDTAENNHNEEIAQSDADTTGQVEAADAFAAEGENGDTEEASKASEEGASVLLKPQVKSSLSEHIDETEPKGSPEGLTTADSADLVTNWVTMHQTSKYFETFVEPLEDIREVNSEASNKQPAELPRSESLVKMVRGGGKDDVMETKDETSDVGSNPSEAKPDESTKDTGQAQESQVLHVPNVDNEETVKEPVIEESLRSKEDQKVGSSEGDKIHDSLVQLNNNVARTSITSSHLSITSGKQTVSEMLNEEKTSDQGQDTTNIQDTIIEELPETLEDLNVTEHTISDAPDNSESKDVTVTTEFTVSKTDSASQQESHKTQDSGNSEEKNKLIEDSSHTVSKEHLSSFSVDNTVFGRSAHTLLTTSTAENGH